MPFQKGHGRLRSLESYKTQDYSYITEDYKQKQSEIAYKKGFGKWMLGKKLNEDTKNKISQSCLGKNIGSKNGMYGGNFSKETRLKMSEAHKGEKCHLWRGGVTPINNQIRSSFEYKNWRRMVFERDNYTCQDCGKRGCRLHAHHKKSFADYHEQRLDIQNGISLCNDCHKKTENYLNKNRWPKKQVEALYPVQIEEP
jgi:5-methylcytosine-specific restriction endonuclease McrA